MPAITLGLAEVEERLRAVRRRLNAVTAQHSAYLGVSFVILVATAVIVVGLRASASTFRLIACGSTLLVIGTVAACVTHARRRWLDLRATAHLADHRGQLTDRLATLVDLRARPRASRLAPVLVAQALTLGSQWQLQRIAPRRVPRSVLLVLASLLALGAASFLVQPAPPPVAAAATTGGDTLARLNSPAPPQPQSGAPNGATGQAAPQWALQPPSNLVPPGASGGSGPTSAQGEQADPNASSGEPRPGTASLTDRLQQKIRQAFNAATSDRPQQLAARSGTSSDGGGESREGRGNDPQRRSGTGAGQSQSEKETGSGQAKRPDQSKSGKPGDQRHGDSNAPQKFEGSSPAAGAGSSPQGLMDSNAPGVLADKEESKRFKLTITSFLHPVPPAENQPPRSGKGAGGSASVPAESAGEVALNDRQLADDALRKAEIPPEYEELVRRVYSLRADQ